MLSKGKCKNCVFSLSQWLLILNLISLTIPLAESQSGFGEDVYSLSGDGPSICSDGCDDEKGTFGSDPTFIDTAVKEGKGYEDNDGLSDENDLFIAAKEPIGANGRGSGVEVLFWDGTKEVAPSHPDDDDASFDDVDFDNQNVVIVNPIVASTTTTTASEETTVEGDTTKEAGGSSEDIGGIGLVKGSIYVGIFLIIAIFAICGIWRCVSIQKRRHHLRHRSILIQSSGQKSDSFRYSTPKKAEPLERKIPEPDVTIRLNPSPVSVELSNQKGYSLPQPVYQETTAPIETAYYGFPPIHMRSDLVNALTNGIQDGSNQNQLDQGEEYGTRTYGEIDSFLDTLGTRYR